MYCVVCVVSIAMKRVVQQHMALHPETTPADADETHLVALGSAGHILGTAVALHYDIQKNQQHNRYNAPHLVALGSAGHVVGKAVALHDGGGGAEHGRLDFVQHAVRIFVHDLPAIDDHDTRHEASNFRKQVTPTSKWRQKASSAPMFCAVNTTCRRCKPHGNCATCITHLQRLKSVLCVPYMRPWAKMSMSCKGGSIPFLSILIALLRPFC